MAEPTGTIAPIEPSASPLMDRIYNYINQPLNTEDPIQNLVSGVADFIPGISTELARRRGDKFGEALSYLDVIGGGIPAEAISFAARRAGLLKKLKREQEILAKETDPSEIAAAQKEITKLQKQIKKMDADNVPSKKPKTFDEIGTKPPSYQEIVERENKRISDELFGVDLDKGFADTPKGYTYKAPPSIWSISNASKDQIERARGSLFRGDKSGMKNFDITDTSDIVPSAGIYSLIDPTDPRFKMFAQRTPSKGGPGSGYVIQPNFENILDIDNIPPDFLKKLENMDIFRNRPSRNLEGGIGDLMAKKRTDFQLDTILRGGPGSINKTPSGLSQDISDIFTKEGYDALRFPPRTIKGESDTIISLNPKNLEITDEIPFNDLDDFIRQLLSE